MQFLAQLVVGFILGMIANWTLCLLMFTCVPLIILILLFMTPILNILAKRSSKQTSGSAAAANEVITSMRTVRSMSGEQKELARFRQSLSSVQATGWLNAAVKGVSCKYSSHILTI
jgi:ATP-binding cassette subfamily B (MDR/TAP) protein 1